MNTGLEQLEHWIEQYKRINGTPPINEILTQIDLLKNYEKEHEHIFWIDVKEKMPDSGQCVLIYSKDGGVAEGAYLSAKGHFEQWRWNAIQKDVTHWMRLPKPPTCS